MLLSAPPELLPPLPRGTPLRDSSLRFGGSQSISKDQGAIAGFESGCRWPDRA